MPNLNKIINAVSDGQMKKVRWLAYILDRKPLIGTIIILLLLWRIDHGGLNKQIDKLNDEKAQQTQRFAEMMQKCQAEKMSIYADFTKALKERIEYQDKVNEEKNKNEIK